MQLGVCGHAHGELVEHMRAIVALRGHHDAFDTAEAGMQHGGVLAALVVHRPEAGHLGDAESRVQLRHPEVETGPHVVVDVLLALIAQDANGGGDRVIVGRHDPALGRRDVLRRVEREAAGAERSDRAALDRRAERLRGVLDDDHVPFGASAADARHIGGPAVQMHGNDGARRWSERVLDLTGIEVEVVRDVDEAGSGTDMQDRVERRHEREGRREHFVALADAVSEQRSDQRAGPAVHRNRVFRADDDTHGFLEAFAPSGP